MRLNEIIIPVKTLEKYAEDIKYVIRHQNIDFYHLNGMEMRNLFSSIADGVSVPAHLKDAVIDFLMSQQTHVMTDDAHAEVPKKEPEEKQPTKVVNHLKKTKPLWDVDEMLLMCSEAKIEEETTRSIYGTVKFFKRIVPKGKGIKWDKTHQQSHVTKQHKGKV